MKLPGDLLKVGPLRRGDVLQTLADAGMKTMRVAVFDQEVGRGIAEKFAQLRRNSRSAASLR